MPAKTGLLYNIAMYCHTIFYFLVIWELLIHLWNFGAMTLWTLEMESGSMKRRGGAYNYINRVILALARLYDV